MLHKSQVFAMYLVFFILSAGALVAFPLEQTIIVNFTFMLGFCLAVLTLFCWKNRLLRYGFLVCFTLLLAFARVDSSSGILLKEENYGKTMVLEATVISEPIVKGSSQKFIVLADKAYRFTVMTNQFPRYKFADRIIVQGVIQKPSINYENNISPEAGFFFYPVISRASNLSGNHWHEMRKSLISLRETFNSSINKLLSEPQASLLSGILIGERSQLSPELMAVMSAVGLVHIIALSGYNITIIANFLGTIFMGWSRRISFIASCFFITLFVLSTGMSSSVVRAAIMGLLLLLSKFIGRKSNPLNLILFAASVMVFINPRIVIYDIGFQLSFAATLGIVLFAPFFEKLFKKLPNIISEALSSSLTAQIFTWPIIAYYFGKFSLISPLANILVLPVIPLLMLCGFFCSVLYFLSPLLSQFLLPTVWGLLEYIIFISTSLGKIRFSSIDFWVNSPIFLLGYYILILEIYLIGRKKWSNRISVIH